MRVPAVSFVRKIAAAAAVSLLACGLALPYAPAFAEGEDAPSALLASSLMDGSASVVREDVALAALEDDAAPEPVIGSFTVDGLTFAVAEGANVQLVGVVAVEADDSTVVLPESVTYEGVEYSMTSIGAYAFYLSGVTSVELPVSVTEVDDRAFRSSDVTSVEVVDGNPTYSSFDGALYDADQLSLLLIPEGKQGTVLLPKTAESAAPSVFSHCPLVTQVSVEEGSAAFASENGLLYDASLTTLLRVPAGATEITIREGCTTIAAGAMEGCASLERVNAPSSVASISPYVFERQPEIVMAPVAVAAVEEDAEDDSADEGEPTDAAPQLSAMVALSSADTGLPIVDPAVIAISLPAGADAAPWRAAGFSVDEPQGDVESHNEAVEGGEGEESGLPVASLDSASTYNGTYDFTIVNAEGSTLYQTNSSGSTNTQIDSRVIACGSSSHQVHVRFLSKGGSLIVQLWHSATSDNSYYRWVKPGYVLVGVKVTNGAGTVTDEIRAAVVGTSYTGASKITGVGRTIAPIFEKVTYAVPLDKAGGTGGSDSVVNVQYGSAMPAITPPTKVGYAFMGYYWSLNGSGTQYYDQSGKSVNTWDRCVTYPTSLSTSVTLDSSYRLVAYWLPAITFDGNGGTVERRNYANSTSSAVLASGTSMVVGSNYYRTHAPNYNLWVYAQNPPHENMDYVNATRTGYTFAGWSTSKAGTALEKVEKTVSISSAITFYALWTPNKYTVSFSANGGSGGQTANVTATYNAAMPTISTAVPVRAGYRFMGYYDNVNYAASGAKQYYTADRTSARNYDKTSNCTLYAGWKQMSTITFDGNGGTAERRCWKNGTSSAVLQSGNSVAVSSDYYRTHTPNANIFVYSQESPLLGQDYMSATRPGYTWKGWSTSKTGTPLAWESKTVDIAANTTLYAIWEANAYTLTFDGQGGTVHRHITLPGTSTYELAESAQTVTTTSTILRTHTVNTNVFADPKNASVSRSDWFNAERAGYTWLGWSLSKSGGSILGGANGVAENIKLTANTSVYAQWSANTIKLTWDSNGGSAVAATTQTYSSTAKVALPTSPTLTGRTFAGWWTAKTGGSQVTSSTALPTASTTYYAHWSTDAYKIEYALDDGTADNPPTYDVTTATFTLKNPTRVGYTFVGWSGTGLAGSSNMTVTIVKGSTGDRSYTAHWTANKYTVSFNANGGTGGQDADVIATFDAAMPEITKEVPIRAGYRFMGYYDNADYASSDAKQYYAASRTSAREWDKASNATLYAGWKKMSAITFDGNGGTVGRRCWKGGSSSEELESGPSLAILSDYYRTHTLNENVFVYAKESPLAGEDYLYATRPGYIWRGWSSSEMGEPLPQVSKSFDVDSDVTFYAAWEKVASFEVVLDANGGDPDSKAWYWPECGYVQGEDSVDVVKIGSALSAEVPKRQGYAFVGYYTEVEGGTQAIDAHGCLTADAPELKGGTTFYAHWTPIVAVAVPLEVTARVDLLGLEEQEAVLDAEGYQGYIESRSGAALDVVEAAFEPLKGAEELFGEDAPNVFLEALPLWSHEIAGVDADVRFSLGAQATEADADHLVAFGLPDGFGTRVPVTYRFDIPEDVLSAIDSARFEQETTPVCSVVYTVALQNPQT